jgi:hypothetical protein
MDVEFETLHDAEVTGLWMLRRQECLTLECHTAGGQRVLLSFEGVRGWRLSEFEDQNVIYAIARVTSDRWLGSEGAQADFYTDVRAVADQAKYVFKIESSVGLAGVVVAEELNFAPESFDAA